MKQTRILIIRHGETEHNKNDEITGQLDIGLNRYGLEQAEKAADRLEKEDFDAVYSSDLERTYETVKIIAERHGLHPEPCKEFRERSFGEFEGRPKDDWRKVARSSDTDKHELSPENGESLRDVGERFLGKLEEIAEEHGGETVLIGGHGVAIKATVMAVLGLDGYGYRKLDQGNTGITELAHDGDWKIIRMNDTAHLEPWTK